MISRSKRAGRRLISWVVEPAKAWASWSRRTNVCRGLDSLVVETGLSLSLASRSQTSMRNILWPIWSSRLCTDQNSSSTRWWSYFELQIQVRICLGWGLNDLPHHSTHSWLHRNSRNLPNRWVMHKWHTLVSPVWWNCLSPWSSCRTSHSWACFHRRSTFRCWHASRSTWTTQTR